MGPVTPLLAVSKSVRATHGAVRELWFGTPDGPERATVLAHGIPFVGVPVARMPRYISTEWLTLPWRYHQALSLARRALLQERVDVVVSVGGFTAVPVIRAAANMGIPCITHQLDRLPGLANRFVADRCERVTSSFAYATSPFGREVPIEQIPTPTRFTLADIPARSQALRQLGLSLQKPTILCMGGGTGAQALNALVRDQAASWVARGWQVMLIAGRGKTIEGLDANMVLQKEFCSPEEMRLFYAATDVLVCRAGMGTLSEAVALRKPLVLVPIPESHQELNARAFAEAEAAIVLDQRDPGFVSRVEQAIARYLTDQAFAHLATGRLSHVLSVDQGEVLAEIVWDAARRHQGAV